MDLGECALRELFSLLDLLNPGELGLYLIHV